MTITIELPAEIEAGLSEQAAAQGLSLQQYLRRLLEQQMPSRSQTVTPQQRADLWRKSTAGLPHTPPLPDEAIARENLYGTRGWMNLYGIRRILTFNIDDFRRYDVDVLHPSDVVAGRASWWRARGAEAVSVVELDYVFSKDNPLYARLEKGL